MTDMKWLATLFGEERVLEDVLRAAARSDAGSTAPDTQNIIIIPMISTHTWNHPVKPRHGLNGVCLLSIHRVETCSGWRWPPHPWRGYYHY